MNNEWIKITPESLPPEGKSVLVWNEHSDDGVKIGYRLSEYPAFNPYNEEDTWEFSTSWGCGSDWETPTHWKELPEPPTKELNQLKNAQ